MKLSLSGRLIEGPNGLLLSLREFLDLAGTYGYDAVDLRAFQLNPHTTEADIEVVRQGLADNGLCIFEANYAETLAKETEEPFVTFVKLLSELGAVGIRMGGDLATLKRAAQLASPYGMKVLYQMHTGGPFETISVAAESIAAIGEPNFGVLPEPANLLMAGEKFADNMFEPLREHVFGVHVQTLEVRDDGPHSLCLSDGTEIRYVRVPFEDNKQIDFCMFFSALRRVGFDGYVNELEPAPSVGELEDTVERAARFLRKFL